MRDHETAGVSAADSLTEATALQQSMWPEVPCSAGPMLAGWTTSAALFSSPSALEEFLDYEGSFDPGVDLKSRAAFLMSDYCYIFHGHGSAAGGPRRGAGYVARSRFIAVLYPSWRA